MRALSTMFLIEHQKVFCNNMDICPPATVAFDDTIQRITDLIFISSPPRAVDIALVLGSPNWTASQPAIDLYHSGLTDWIAISGHGRGSPSEATEWQIHRDVMVASGVPEKRILIDKDATNTLENVIFSARLIEKHIGWSQVGAIAICCKPLHSRRALLTAQTHFPAGRSISVHCPNDPLDVQADNWWRSPSGHMRVMGELLRIGEYTQKGDIRISGPNSDG